VSLHRTERETDDFGEEALLAEVDIRVQLRIRPAPLKRRGQINSQHTPSTKTGLLRSEFHWAITFDVCRYTGQREREREGERERERDQHFWRGGIAGRDRRPCAASHTPRAEINSQQRTTQHSTITKNRREYGLQVCSPAQMRFLNKATLSLWEHTDDFGEEALLSQIDIRVQFRVRLRVLQHLRTWDIR
jgi:hypothetical protein